MINGQNHTITQHYQYQASVYRSTGSIGEQQHNTNRKAEPGTQRNDTVSVSDKGRSLSRNPGSANVPDEISSEDNRTQSEEKKSNPGSNELSASEESALRKLKARDQQVKAHEQAHLASAGQYARGGASFVYQTGPDGKIYAVGGEVSIDIGKETTPEATVTKMQVVRRAALAPAQPSSTDRQVAAQATARLNQAQQQIQQQRMADIQDNMNDEFPGNQSSEIADNNSTISSSTTAGATRKLMVETYKAVNEYL